jgi:hypothetical protein
MDLGDRCDWSRSGPPEKFLCMEKKKQNHNNRNASRLFAADLRGHGILSVPTSDNRAFWNFGGFTAAWPLTRALPCKRPITVDNTSAGPTGLCPIFV